LKASLPASVLLYTFYLRLALKKRDFDLADKTIQEMEALKMDTQFEQRMLFDFAAMYNEPRALQMWKQLVEKHQGIDTINPHVASTALTIISAVEPETCKKILGTCFFIFRRHSSLRCFFPRPDSY
jgi:AAA15 family ATPase/GTPase